MFRPTLLAFAQLDDPVFRGVLWRGVAWSFVVLALLFAGSQWAVHHYLHPHGWWAWLTGALGAVIAAVSAALLFLPFATLIGTFYMEPIAVAVERRYYPALPPPSGSSLLEQAWDGTAVALKVLLLSIAGLVVTITVPGVGFMVGWAVAAYGLGRGLFVAVAMRRVPRAVAENIYRSNRGVVFVQGGILAAASYVPILNFLSPVIGVATMVHAFDIAIARPPDRFR